MVCLRRKWIKVPYDERVLGSGEFVEQLLEEVEGKERETLRLSSRVPDLRALAKSVSEIEKVDEVALRSGSRLRRVLRTRKRLCQLAVR